MPKMMSEGSFTNIVGVVADIRRDQENDFACSRTCVFGLDDVEHEALKKVADVTPRIFTEEVERVVVKTNPWRVMRLLGSEFGYHYSVTPLGGSPVVATSGERRTCIWTLIREVKKM